MLACEIQVQTESTAFADRLRYLVQHASQDHEITDRAVYEIAYDGDDIVLREDGAVAVIEHNSEILFEALFKKIHQRALAALPNDIRIHAASGIHNGRMFVLVGNPHAGKTTLAIHLLSAGMEIIGDELVMLRDGLAVAFPRKFYPRETSFELLPDFKDAAVSLPLVYDSDGMRRLAVDPIVFGHSWKIARLPIGNIFYLDPNFGSPTTIKRCTKIDMVRLVMEQCGPPPSRRANWIGDLCAVVNGASTRILELGDLDSALAIIRQELA
jgi:sulfur transfer complex TusBCD TusB component (DsrH family)